MIDGIQLLFHTSNPKTHLLDLSCWEILVDERTNQRVNDIRSTKIRGLNIQLKPSADGGYNLLINGSLHKYHNGGEHNADQFSFFHLCQSIDGFTDVLEIDAEKTTIHGLEIGVNIQLPCSPLKLLKNLVCYRSNPFTPINKRNVGKGWQCTLSQYSVKIYDKAKVSGIDCGNVLRVEIHMDKMQAMKKYNINTLADLQNEEKVFSLLGVLCDAISYIIWTDTTVNLNRLSSREQKQWLYYSNHRTWQTFGKDKRKRANKIWKNLLSKYGNPIDLLPMVTATWQSLFLHKIEAQNQPPSYQPDNKIEALETATFLPLECTVRTRRRVPGKYDIVNAGFCITEINNINREKRLDKATHPIRCLSCDRDISNQRKGSVFCSQSLYGKAGKRCRNKNSNNRRNKNNRINSAIQMNKYLAITYTDGSGSVYTDILYPTEIIFSRPWIDRVITAVAI